MDIKEIGHLKEIIGADQQVLKKSEDSSFSALLKESINKVDTLKKEADNALIDLVSKKGASIHETMLAVEKADLSFRMMMQVRNKIIEAYQEVMRMSV